MSRASRLLVFAFLFVSVSIAAQQLPEVNVNMVSGQQWPGGDPFLRQQNEPSIAVSSRNPLHLLAGANDFRSVDINFPASPRPDDEDTGDAWLGVFKSTDGGNRWFSTLLDGYPQQGNLSSPLNGYQAGADPVVRAANNGLFYYGGIVLNRGTNPLSAVFIARFIDRNNVQKGDPIAFLETKVLDKGSSGQFIDKPWIAVAPMTNGGQCTVDGQTFPAQNVYVAYTVLVGNDNNIRTKMMFTRSTDCGNTWASPQKLSETFSINQGATVAVDPSNGNNIYVVWRRFAGGNDPNSIIVAKSTNAGATFTKGLVVPNITQPFDQNTAPGQIRTNAYPTVAVDNTGRVYVAFAQRNALLDGQIFLTTSADGFNNWSLPAVLAPIVGGTSAGRGHQFMPAMTFSAGKLTVAWYDLRDDSTVAEYTLQPDTTYAVSRTAKGNLLFNPPQPQIVFWSLLSDTSPDAVLPLVRRHTLDVYATESTSLGPVPAFADAKRITRYKYGSVPPFSNVPPYARIQDLQINPPNLPMFRTGTVPFFGDYIDVAAYVNSSPTANGNARVRHVVWTDNRDVRVPPGHPPDWTKYVPVQVPGLNGNTSIFDPNKTRDPCTVDNHGYADYAGSRNQNIYTTRVTDGLFAGSPGNAKPLGGILHAFTIFVQNATNFTNLYHLSFAQPLPVGTTASFLQFTPAPTLDVNIPPHSTATRMVFVSGPAHARVDVIVAGGGLTTVISLNPDSTNPDDPAIANNEVFNPEVANPEVANPEVANPEVANPEVANPEVANPEVANPEVANPEVANPEVANPEVANPEVANPEVANGDIANSSMTDTNWNASNGGTTTGGYTVKLFKTQDLPPGVTARLILNKIYDTPIARGCTLGVEHNRQVIASIPMTNADFVTDPNALSDPSLNDPSEKNATLWLMPGETGRITLRLMNITPGLPLNAGNFVTPVVIAQSANTGDTQPKVATLLAISTVQLPDATVGSSYSTTLQSIGGVGTARNWTVVKGLPLGLKIDPSTGVLSGTPILPADSFVTFQVTDAANPANKATRTLSLHVGGSQQQIGGITPSTAAAGFGQLVFIDIANYFLPSLTGAKVWFTDGNVVEPGFLFLSPSTPSAIYARLPFVNDGLGSTNLSSGPITVYVTAPGQVRGPATITLSSTPGAPTIRTVYGLEAPPGQGTTCGGTIVSEVSAISSGQGLAVSGYGIDTVGATLRFQQGDAITDVPWACGEDTASLGEASTFTVPPLSLQLGSVTVSMSVNVNGVQSAFSAPVTLGVVGPTFACAANTIVLLNTWTNGGTGQPGVAPGFSTNGQTYCLDSIADYHWNGGDGIQATSIGLTSVCGVECLGIGPFAAVGSPSPNAGLVNWTMTPPGQVLLNGVYTVVDTDAATWSYDLADAKKTAFSKVIVRPVYVTTPNPIQ